MLIICFITVKQSDHQMLKLYQMSNSFIRSPPRTYGGEYIELSCAPSLPEHSPHFLSTPHYNDNNELRRRERRRKRNNTRNAPCLGVEKETEVAPFCSRLALFSDIRNSPPLADRGVDMFVDVVLVRWWRVRHDTPQAKPATVARSCSLFRYVCTPNPPRLIYYVYRVLFA